MGEAKRRKEQGLPPRAKKNEKKTIKDLQEGLKFQCKYKEMKKENDMWNRDYKKQGYKFMTNDKIYKEVSKLLSK